MPATLIELRDGHRLEKAVREWTDATYRADYTLDGRYVASVRWFRTKANPQGRVWVRMAALPASDVDLAVCHTTLAMQACIDGNRIEEEGMGRPELVLVPRTRRIQ